MPSEPGPSSAVIAGGTSGVPGAIGGGELRGAGMPSPAPTKPTGTPGRRCSVWKRNRKPTSGRASWSLSIKNS